VCDLETSRIGAPYIYNVRLLRVNIILPFLAVMGQRSPPLWRSLGERVHRRETRSVGEAENRFQSWCTVSAARMLFARL